MSDSYALDRYILQCLKISLTAAGLEDQLLVDHHKNIIFDLLDWGRY